MACKCNPEYGIIKTIFRASNEAIHPNALRNIDENRHRRTDFIIFFCVFVWLVMRLVLLIQIRHINESLPVSVSFGIAAL